MNYLKHAFLKIKKKLFFNFKIYVIFFNSNPNFSTKKSNYFVKRKRKNSLGLENRPLNY